MKSRDSTNQKNIKRGNLITLPEKSRIFSILRVKAGFERPTEFNASVKGRHTSIEIEIMER